MKKIIALTVIAVCGFYSTTMAQGMSAKAKKNWEVNTAIMKAYAAGDFSKMGNYIAADAVDHGSETGDIKGLDNIVKEMKRYHDMMPDMKYVVVKELADDEYVFSWTKITGTMNGKMTTMNGMDVSKFKDGKAVEHWVFMDPKDMMQMMPPPPAPEEKKQ